MIPGHTQALAPSPARLNHLHQPDCRRPAAQAYFGKTPRTKRGGRTCLCNGRRGPEFRNPERLDRGYRRDAQVRLPEVIVDEFFIGAASCPSIGGKEPP